MVAELGERAGPVEWEIGEGVGEGPVVLAEVKGTAK